MLSFYHELDSTHPYTLHSHTQFCDGRFTMAEFAEAAAKAGFSHYGFSPHAPITVESGCNMRREDVGAYLTEADRLKELYDGRVKIYTSMEIDYLGDDWGPAHEYFRALPLDYRIGSVHFVPTQEGVPVDVDGSPERFAARLRECFHNDLRYVVEKFFEQTINMVERGGFDIIGHFDKIALNASHVEKGIDRTEWYEALVSDLINRIEAKGTTVEINTKHYAKYGLFFPDVRFWKELENRRIPIVVNSDAHYTDLINSSRQEALALLQEVRHRN